jgi:acetyl esterase/lipase
MGDEAASETASSGVDVRPMLDPAMRDAFGTFELPDMNADVLMTIRSSSLPPAQLSGRVERTDHLVPGEPPVPVRVHRSAGAEGTLPAILTIHGGGYIIGSYDMDDALLDRWCQNLGVVGVSVQYRLAPETPYPGAVEDCYAALRWTHQHAHELGIDPACIGIQGISAGGGLAAALALLARDRGEVPVAFQLLDCPMLDDRQTTPSIGADGLYVWTGASNVFGWRSYLGDLYGSTEVPPYAAAARAMNLSDLPPACVVVGAIDGFRDEDIDYAQRLNQAGVPCELHVLAGMPHAYQLAASAPAVVLAEQCKEDWLARQLARPATP